NKDNAGGFLLRLLEEIAYPRRPDPREHLDKVRAAEAEKRYTGLARHRPGQERFARPWRANQQDPFGNTTTKRDVLLWLPQEIDNLLEFFLGLLGVCHIGKGDPRGGFYILPRPALAKLHHPLSQAYTTQHEGPDNDAQAQGNQPRHEGLEPRIVVLSTVLHALRFQLVEQVGILDAHGDKGLGWGIFVLSQRAQSALQSVRLDLYLRNPTLAQHGLEIAIR